VFVPILLARKHAQIIDSTSSFKSTGGVTYKQGAAVIQPWHGAQEPQTIGSSCPLHWDIMGWLLKTSGLLSEERFMVWGDTGEAVKPCITRGKPRAGILKCSVSWCRKLAAYFSRLLPQIRFPVFSSAHIYR